MTTPEPDDNGKQGLPKFVMPELAASITSFSERLNEQLTAQFKGIDLMQKQLAETAFKVSTFKMPPIIPDGFLEGLRLQEQQLSDGLRKVIQRVTPQNWPSGALRRLSEIETILQDDGIPVIDIPRAEIVTALLDAQTADDRFDIIEARAEEIAEDCKTAISAPLHTAIEKQTPLVLNAVESHLAGHYASAQALAVLVCDTYIKEYLGGTTTTAEGRQKRISYADMAAAVAIETSMNGPLGLTLNILYAFAPVAPFLTEWWPDDPNPGPPPTTLSRHVSVHKASTDFMTKRNATIAIMLATSLSIAIDRMNRYKDQNP